jgi:hypothetical protein
MFGLVLAGNLGMKQTGYWTDELTGSGSTDRKDVCPVAAALKYNSSNILILAFMKC